MKEGTINVNCPGESCSRFLDYDEIKEYGEEAAFSKYPSASPLSLSYLTIGTMSFSAAKSTRKILISGGVPIAPVRPAKSSKVVETFPHPTIDYFRVLFPLYLSELQLQILFPLSYTCTFQHQLY